MILIHTYPNKPKHTQNIPPGPNHATSLSVTQIIIQEDDSDDYQHAFFDQ